MSKKKVKSLQRQLKRQQREVIAQLEERAQITTREVVDAQVESRCAQIEVEAQQRAQRVIVEAEAQLIYTLAALLETPIATSTVTQEA